MYRILNTSELDRLRTKLDTGDFSSLQYHSSFSVSVIDIANYKEVKLSYTVDILKAYRIINEQQSMNFYDDGNFICFSESFQPRTFYIGGTKDTATVEIILYVAKLKPLIKVDFNKSKPSKLLLLLQRFKRFLFRKN